MLKSKEKSRKKTKIFNFITKVGILSALCLILYFIRFPLPFFPPFLKVQFSNLAVILGGFMLGPLGGSLIAVVKTVISLPFTSTAMVGELADLLISLSVVIPSALIYKETRSKLGGLLSIVIAMFMWVVAGIFTNYFINIPFYSKAFGMEAIVNMCSAVFPGVTPETFMHTYIVYAVIPFNLMLSSIVCCITFLVYKRVSFLFKKDIIKSKNAPKVLVCCDSFKGTMSSKTVCRIISEELNKNGFDAIQRIISDGGEGFLEAVNEGSKGLTKVKIKVNDALGRIHSAYYLYDSKENIAYLELAECCGINQLVKSEYDVLNCSTYGLGQAIKHAVDTYNVKDIVVGLGGSASNDGGVGMLEALGVEFFDGERFHMQGLCGGQLKNIHSIDYSSLKKYEDIHFECLTDVNNSLLGYSGATYVYGPQKGATREDLVVLEAGMERYASLVESILKVSKKAEPYTGCAGGTGFAFATFLNAELKSGIRELLTNSDIKDLIPSVDYVITGEGTLDEQSYNGKVISGIMEYKPKDIRFVVGISKVNMDNVYAVVPTICTADDSFENPTFYLRKLIDTKVIKDL